MVCLLSHFLCSRNTTAKGFAYYLKFFVPSLRGGKLLLQIGNAGNSPIVVCRCNGFILRKLKNTLLHFCSTFLKTFNACKRPISIHLTWATLITPILVIVWNCMA